MRLSLNEQTRLHLRETLNPFALHVKRRRGILPAMLDVYARHPGERSEEGDKAGAEEAAEKGGVRRKRGVKEK